jgi:hypothetical protein
MLRQFFGLFFLILWLFQGVFFYLFFQINRNLHRAEQFEAIEKKAFSEKTLLIFEKTTPIDWQEEGREFVWQGQFYDVIEIQDNGNQILISCIADHEETEMAEAYQQKSQENSLPNEKEKTFKKGLDFHYWCEKPFNINCLDFFFSPSKYNDYCSYRLICPFIAKIAPPPWP